MTRDLIPGGTRLKNPKCLGGKNHPIVPNLSRLDSHRSGLSFKPRQSPIGQELGEIEAKYSRDTCAPSPETSRAAPITFPSPMDLSHLLGVFQSGLELSTPKCQDRHILRHLTLDISLPVTQDNLTQRSESLQSHLHPLYKTQVALCRHPNPSLIDVVRC